MTDSERGASTRDPLRRDKTTGLIGGVRRRALALAMLVAITAGASPAWGAAIAAEDQAAQQAFRDGVEAARQGRWADARARFEQAYELSPRPVVLINLAGAQARTGMLRAAVGNYRRILEEETAPETASFRRAAADVLPALEARIPSVQARVSGLVPTDTIAIDDEPVTAESLGAGVPLDPGNHALVIKRGAAERARVLFSLAEREHRQIDVPLPAEPVAVAPVPKLTASPPASTPAPGATLVGAPSDGNGDAEPGDRSLWRSPWTWVAVGAVLVAAGAVTYVVLDRQNEPYMGNVPPGSISVK